MSDTRLPPVAEAPPLSYPLARGIETRTYRYPKRVDKPLMNDTTQPALGSTTALYHDCGGEWTFSGGTEYTDGVAWYRGKCGSCGTIGRARQQYPIVK